MGVCLGENVSVNRFIPSVAGDRDAVPSHRIAFFDSDADVRLPVILRRLSCVFVQIIECYLKHFIL